jgi:branched-chain amino acid transport system ATP-binding protein
LKCRKGKIVALLGGNGAGKSTTLKSISTLLGSERGAVTKGSIEFRGQRTDQLTPGELVGMGLVQVMEGRHCFGHLTAEENLITGAYARSISRAQMREELDRIYAYFPRLKVRRSSLAGYTFGRRAADDRHRPRHDGEAEHAVARRTVDGPRPADRCRDLRDRPRPQSEGRRQYPAGRAEYQCRAEIRRLRLHSGKRTHHDGRPARALADNKDVKEFYLGMSSEGRKSFRDMKSYRRRKRWV